MVAWSKNAKTLVGGVGGGGRAGGELGGSRARGLLMAQAAGDGGGQVRSPGKCWETLDS